jgi:hypothetical protein
VDLAPGGGLDDLRLARVVRADEDGVQLFGLEHEVEVLVGPGELPLLGRLRAQLGVGLGTRDELDLGQGGEAVAHAPDVIAGHAGDAEAELALHQAPL